MLVGAAAAVLAGVVLLVYLHSYRNSVNSSAVPATVLVAKNLIQKGTPGDIIGSTRQFQVASLPQGQLQSGAFTDPGVLTGRVAVADIYPGQQFTASNFALAPPDLLQNKITGVERVINISTDAEHGLIGQISPGDHVDIFIGFNLKSIGGSRPVIKLLLPNVEVLRVPVGAGGNLTLKVPVRQAAELAYAADNGTLWFVLRPPSGAKTVNPGIINANTLLAAPPVR
jgi:Flp pilus assembly protein CpaB